MYVVMELMSGGELFDRIVEKDKYTEEETRVAFKMIMNAMGYLHDNDIVHRDLKPENLLYSSDEPHAELKVADFGLAHMVSDNQLLKHVCGTPAYVAPEMLAKKGYGKAADMWSLGVILYILLSGCPPFYQEDHAELFQAIMTGDYDYPSPDWDDVSPKARDLVEKLMCVDPASRLNVKQVLEHEFMVDEASSKHKEGACKALRRFNARRRFKKGILAVQMIAAMSNAVKVHKKDGEGNGGGGGVSAAASLLSRLKEPQACEEPPAPVAADEEKPSTETPVEATAAPEASE